MIRFGLAIGLLAGFAACSIANAAKSHFLFPAMSAPTTSFNFDLSASPTPTNSIAGISFTLPGVSICDYQVSACDFPNPSDLTFFTAAAGGGIFRTGGYFDGIRYFGDSLFTGSVDEPVLTSGTFALVDNQLQNTSLVEVTAAQAVPELQSWLMMIAGLGATGVRMRARRRKDQLASAIG